MRDRNGKNLNPEKTNRTRTPFCQKTEPEPASKSAGTGTEMSWFLLGFTEWNCT